MAFASPLDPSPKKSLHPERVPALAFPVSKTRYAQPLSMRRIIEALERKFPSHLALGVSSWVLSSFWLRCLFPSRELRNFTGSFHVLHAVETRTSYARFGKTGL